MRLRRRIRITGFFVAASLLFLCSSRATHAWAGPPAHANVSSAKVLYLTFDDGPSLRYTPLILQELHHYNVGATFFLLGSRAEQFPEIVKQIRKEGHEIGSHGYGHLVIAEQSKQRVLADVVKADGIFEGILHEKPILYRPPEGKYTNQSEELLAQMGHPLVLWNVDSHDWKGTTSAAQIIRSVEQDVHPGSIVLFHDGVSNSKSTVRALHILLPYFREKGYHFAELPIPAKYRHVSGGSGHLMMRGRSHFAH